MTNLIFNFSTKNTYKEIEYEFDDSTRHYVRVYGLKYGSILTKSSLYNTLYQGLLYLESKYENNSIFNINIESFYNLIIESTNIVDIGKDPIPSELDRMISDIIDLSIPNILKYNDNQQIETPVDFKSRNIENKKLSYYENIGISSELLGVIKMAEKLRVKGFDVENLTLRKIYSLTLIHNDIDNEEEISKMSNYISAKSIFEIENGKKILNDRILELKK